MGCIQMCILYIIYKYDMCVYHPVHVVGIIFYSFFYDVDLDTGHIIQYYHPVKKSTSKRFWNTIYTME